MKTIPDVVCGVWSGTRRHFTLVEVMIAFGVSGLVLASALTLFSIFLYSDDMVTKRNTALSIARSQLDYLRTVPYISLATAAEDSVRVNGEGALDETGLFLRSTTIGNSTDSTPCKSITVTAVCPRILRRPTVTVTLSTIVVDRGQIIGMQ